VRPGLSSATGKAVQISALHVRRLTAFLVKVWSGCKREAGMTVLMQVLQGNSAMTVLMPALQGETDKSVLTWALSNASDMTVQMQTLQGNSFRPVLMPAHQGGKDRLVLMLKGIHVMTTLMQAPQEGSGMTALMPARQEMQVSPGYGAELCRAEIKLILHLH